MKPIVLIVTVSILAGGCTQDIVSTAPESLQPEPAVSHILPKPDDITEFKADSFTSGIHFKDFKVGKKDLEDILSTWHQVSFEHWQHGYSHVAFGDTTGTVKLKDDTTIRWMVKPGGLAKLSFQDGTTLYLARELTPWINKTEVAYMFLLKKVQQDNINLIASKDDKNLDLVKEIIQTNKFNLAVENYNDLEKGVDLCHYSKSEKQAVAIIDVTKRNEKNYYVSYYIGPEGGASKEILIKKRNGKWVVVNDDGMWSVK